MQNSTIVLLINDDARAIRGQYEDGGKITTFKTLNQDIKEDDLVVVESSTRHGMTIVKVVEVDVDINFDTEADVKWVVQRVDTDLFKRVQEQEKEAIAAVQSAERRRKKEALRDSLRVEVDVDINFDTEADVKWVVQRVDTDLFKRVQEQEKEAIAAVQSAERRRKKEALRDSLFADHQDKIKALKLANMEDNEVTE